MALPAFDKNGKAAGIWLSPLTDRDGRLEAIGGEGRIMGNEDARFVALQNSRNGESLLAGNMGKASEWPATIPIRGWWCGWPVMTAPEPRGHDRWAGMG